MPTDSVKKFFKQSLLNESRGRARAILKSISTDKILTTDDLDDIFGNLKYEECHEAFKEALGIGQLLEIAPGQYCKAGHTKEELNKICENDRLEINLISQTVMTKIKEIIMRRAKEVSNFPLIYFGIYSDKVSRVPEATAILKSGIILKKDDDVRIILTPEGIFHYHTTIAWRTEEKIRTSEPDLQSQQERTYLYLQYGNKAIHELAKHSK